MSYLPSNLIAPLTSITTLHIVEVNFDAPPQTARDILEFLAFCPNLQSFYYQGQIHDTSPPKLPLPIARLPSLTHLTIRNTCTARAFLSHLDTPSLIHLHLGYLNVDFPLMCTPTDYEDGDSEDEANDFSQSPSSDRANGMGLRALMKRCSPPIEVLEMDYSDMRTKDFIWCFKRLTKLKEFKIVASDMSDTVIKMLKPHVAYGTPDPIDVGGDDDSAMSIATSSTIHVGWWLPSLQKLYLQNCQCLSGEAIVEALSTRAALRRANSEEYLLEDIGIVGCEEFEEEPEHLVQLRRVYGKRIRIQN
jgi:hypothetical protein